MSFLGKFFQNRADTSKDLEVKGDDGPPIPKKQEAGVTTQAPKKRFEKPNIIKDQPSEAQPEPAPQISESDTHLEAREEAPPLQEASFNGTDSNMEKVGVQPPATKPLGFLEKMKLKREQEEAASRSRVDNSYQNTSGNGTQDAEPNQPLPEQVLPSLIPTEPKSTLPKFPFFKKTVQHAPEPSKDEAHGYPDESISNTNLEHSHTNLQEVQQENGNHPQPDTQAAATGGGSKLPFRFLNKVKTTQPPVEESPDKYHEQQGPSPNQGSRLHFLNKQKAQLSPQVGSSEHLGSPRPTHQDDTLNLSIGGKATDQDLGEIMNRDEDEEDEELNSHKLHRDHRSEVDQPKDKEDNFVGGC